MANLVQGRDIFPEIADTLGIAKNRYIKTLRIVLDEGPVRVEMVEYLGEKQVELVCGILRKYEMDNPVIINLPK